MGSPAIVYDEAGSAHSTALHGRSWRRTNEAMPNPLKPGHASAVMLRGKRAEAPRRGRAGSEPFITHSGLQTVAQAPKSR